MSVAASPISTNPAPVRKGGGRFWIGFLIGAVVSPLVLGAVGLVGIVLIAAANKGGALGGAAPVALSYPEEPLPRENGERGFAEVTNRGSAQLIATPILVVTKEKLQYTGEKIVLGPGETKRLEWWGDRYHDSIMGRDIPRIKAFSRGDVIQIQCDGYAAVEDTVP